MPESAEPSTPTRGTPAVLFLIFNRPAHTREAFAALRQARPPRLYVAADGPRPGREGEAERCAQARAIATAVDWPCTVHTLFREHNLGCRRAVSGGISWFFQHESEGLIIEDDCVPSPDFFRYCAFALERWRDEPRVMHIGAHVPLPRPGQPVAFSRVVSISAWATWRRAWVLYDDTMSRLDELDRLPLRQWFGARAAAWRRHIRSIHLKNVDAWGARWVLTVLVNDGLCVMPGVNLVRNIGYGADATHTLVVNHLANLPTAPLPALLQPPEALHADAAYDEQYLAVMAGAQQPVRHFLRRVAGRLIRWRRRWAEWRGHRA